MQRYSRGEMWKSWWLFRATDFQSLMYLCFTICQIFGMLPYKINASVFETSKSRHVLSTLVVCVCCVINVIIIHDFITFQISLKTVIKDMQGVCFFACSGFIMIFAYILNGRRMRVLQSIWKVSSKLPARLYQNLSKMVHIKDILGTVLILMELYLYYANPDALNYMNALSKVFSLYCVLLIFHMNMLYINCVCVLKLCFKSINDNLTRIQGLAVDDATRCGPIFIYGVQRSQFLLIELKELQKQHLRVSGVVKTLNLIFSPQLLSTVLMIFTVMTFELYYCAVGWQNGSLLISLDKLFEVIVRCMLFYLILLTLLVWACETCKNEAYEICTTIHYLLNNVVDEQVKDELHLFSLQTLHCKDIFSAKGFSVDAMLFAQVVGSVTTYTLILIQFLIASHSCDVNNL